MKKQNPDIRNFLTGALGYTLGAVAGFIFIVLVTWIGIVDDLSGQLEDTTEPDDLARVMDRIGDHFDFRAEAEIAIEADPRTLTGAMIDRIAAYTSIATGAPSASIIAQSRSDRSRLTSTMQPT